MPGTAILVTRFLSEQGVVEVVDFMPIEKPGTATDRHRLIRMITGIRGTVKFEARVEPRFDYARAKHKTHVSENGAVFDHASPVLSLSSSWPVEAAGDGARVRFTVKAGETGAMILESGKSARPAKISENQLTRWYAETTEYWRHWLARSSYQGRWRESVERSAITLKLHAIRTHRRHGRRVPTAGLPGQVGGPRNWDYRYTGSASGVGLGQGALLNLGFTDEAIGLGAWIRDRVEERPAATEDRAAGHHVPRRRQLRPHRSSPWTTSRDTRAPARSASATGPPTSCNSTSTARPSTPFTGSTT